MWGRYSESLPWGHYSQTHQYGQVSLRRAPNHVGYEAFVAWGIQNGKVLFLCLKVCSAHLHSLALVSLLLVGVEGPGQVPRRGGGETIAE